MRLILASLFCIAFLSCKDAQKETNSNSTLPVIDKIVSIEIIGGPVANIKRVFEAHGGLDTWKKQKTLVYDLPKPDFTETHSIDLISRKDKITSANHTMGYDGEAVWLLDVDESYQGDPIFYHNLMFYFYAMPFVLADEGINFSATEDLEYEGVSYPGLRITYDNGVGTSPKDEYYLHYHPETYQMQWLGYTVTYRSGEPSDNVKWIRYNDRMKIDGLVLPKSITWHDYEGRTIKEEKSTVTFENVSLSTAPKNDDFFQKPDNAILVVKQ